MCVSCGQELCKNCKECHNPECERYVEPGDSCEIVLERLPIYVEEMTERSWAWA